MTLRFLRPSLVLPSVSGMVSYTIDCLLMSDLPQKIPYAGMMDRMAEIIVRSEAAADKEEEAGYAETRIIQALSLQFLALAQSSSVREMPIRWIQITGPELGGFFTKRRSSIRVAETWSEDPSMSAAGAFMVAEDGSLYYHPRAHYTSPTLAGDKLPEELKATFRNGEGAFMAPTTLEVASLAFEKVVAVCHDIQQKSEARQGERLLAAREKVRRIAP